jgi:hypothetical protein
MLLLLFLIFVLEYIIPYDSFQIIKIGIVSDFFALWNTTKLIKINMQYILILLNSIDNIDMIDYQLKGIDI